MQELNLLVEKILKQKRQQRHANNSDSSNTSDGSCQKRKQVDLLDLLLSAHEESETTAETAVHMTDKQLHSHALTFILAGR